MKRLGKWALISLFWVLVWQLLAVFTDNEILLATPLQAAEALVRIAESGSFWNTILTSIARIGAGFFLGLGAALLLAALSSRSRWCEELLAPLMLLCRAVPIASFTVLLLIWWGSSFLAVAICFIVVLPNVYISTLEGVKNADKALLEMAQVFKLPLRTRLLYIYRPALKPFIDSSLKLSLGMCWKSGVAAEVIGTPDFSIGERLYMSKIYLDTAGVLAWTAVIILLSVGFERLVLRLADSFFSWQPANVQPAAVKERKCTMGMILEGVGKTYGETRVLENLNAKYEPGKTYYLTSPSGSGKTTLLRILCGLEKPDEGTVYTGLCCSMMFQEDRLCGEADALRNIELVTGSSVRAKEALNRLLGEEAAKKPCRELSGGMKRRVALIRAMEADSECVLLDEPFAGLDAAARETAEAYIRERQAGRILIIATHI